MPLTLDNISSGVYDINAQGAIPCAGTYFHAYPVILRPV
jgi:hypothetical protein